MAKNEIFPFQCLFFLIVTILVLRVGGGDILPLGFSLTGNQTLISKNGTFELGFCKPNGTNNWYIGIWYAQVAEAIVWVANREAPLLNMSGVLVLGTDGYLTISDTTSRSIWSSKKTQKAKASRALILDSGNFLMVGAQNTSEAVWESFGDPTDTLLPGMKFWKGMKIKSWKNSVDPASGLFSLEIDPDPGKTQLLLVYNNSVLYWTSGEWTGESFSNVPESTKKHLRKQEFKKISPTRMYYTFSTTNMLLARIVLSSNGGTATYVQFDNTIWTLVKWQPTQACDIYAVCGPFGACMSNVVLSCSCIKGFKPADEHAWNVEKSWSNGCVRVSPLQCSVTNGTTDGFLQLSDKTLPNDKAVIYIQEHTQERCKIACLGNCSCTAFASINSNPAICRLWFGDLLNMRPSTDGRPLFIRSAVSELISSSSMGRGRSRVPAVPISLAVASATFAAILAFLFICSRRPTRQKEKDMTTLLRTFSYKKLKKATKNFSHKLGSGAFGSVFKGTLVDSTIVAVKKLESSGQGEKEFRAEISTIGNIQHVNLVRLLGFCTEGSQRLLVYEYLPNGSLNSFLSHKSGGAGMVLDWKTRFEIALGITKGLVYLHEECRDRIIHCDIKPENILLDTEFCQKIADFGLAKLVGRDFSRVLTSTRGTRGYLAPEWISGLPITTKVDVYSFGMMLLEIISGRRYVDMTVQESSRYYFPSWAATQIYRGNNTLDIVDERIANNADVEEVRRAVLVSMLCIQENENLRPNIGEVLLLLEGNVEIDTNNVERSLQVLVEDHVMNDSAKE
ncbi:hypothetical protein KI387_034072 [Taxus chinensis]|uniref:Receptor-like serine/threonine-protein kinase n=1 Tax=Taxus chinensis TaxID=29808 RepID=A0AA38BVI4_TAXCH|nr:hypothetical protein KI387_034072 [Taxus chinensis]